MKEVTFAMALQIMNSINHLKYLMTRYTHNLRKRSQISGHSFQFISFHGIMPII